MDVSSIMRPTRASLRQANLIFTRFFFAGAAIVGPVMSLLAHGAMLVGIFRLFARSYPPFLSRDVKLVAAIFAAYPAAELLSVIVNRRGVGALQEVIEQIIFLAVIPVAARLALTSARSVLQSACEGAAVGAVLAFGFGLLQFYWLAISSLPEAGFGNATVLSSFALLACAICLIGLMTPSIERDRLLGLGLVSAIGCVLISGIRLSWLMLPVVILTVFVMLRGGAWLKSNWRRVLIAIPVVLFMAALAWPVMLPRIIQLLASLAAVGTGVDDGSIGHRIEMLRGGIALALERPLFGYGPDRIRELISSMSDGRYEYSHFHNFLLTAQLRSGLFGLASVIGCIAVLGVVAWRRRGTPLANAGRALLVVLAVIYAVPGLMKLAFDHDVMNAMFVYTTIIGLVLLADTSDVETARDPSK